MDSTKSPPISSGFGESCLFYLDLCIFLIPTCIFPVFHLSQITIKNERIFSNMKFNIEEIFKFKPQFYPWAQTPPCCPERRGRHCKFPFLGEQPVLSINSITQHLSKQLFHSWAGKRRPGPLIRGDTEGAKPPQPWWFLLVTETGICLSREMSGKINKVVFFTKIFPKPPFSWAGREFCFYLLLVELSVWLLWRCLGW